MPLLLSINEIKTIQGMKYFKDFDLVKLGLTWLWYLGFRLELIFDTVPEASNGACFKSGQ